MRSLRAHALAGLALAGIALLLYGPLLAPGQAPYSAYSDAVAEHLALKQVAYEVWRGEGRLPLWREDQFFGSAALTNPQALYLHPLHAAFFWLRPIAALGITFVVQFWFAGFGCYALARTLGSRWWAALFSGCAGLCAFKLILAAHAGWLAPLATLAVVPWLLAALLRVGREPTLARGIELAWVAALAFAGGSPQPLYYAGLLMLPHLARSVRSLLLTAAALAIGLLCNAYLWLPLASQWSLLSRAHAGGDYGYFLSGHGLGLADLVQLLYPGALGAAREPWERAAYFGIVPLALAAVGAVTAPARSLERYVAFAFLASLALSLDTPLLRAVHAVVPGYASFRLPGRMLFLTTFLGIGLSGVGLEWLLRRLPASAPRHAAIGIAVAAMLVVCVEGRLNAAKYLATRPSSELAPDAAHPLRSSQLPAAARTAIVGRRTLNYGWSAELELRAINGYDPYNYAHAWRYMGLVNGTAQALPTNWFDVKQLARPDLLDELAVRRVLSAAPLELSGVELRARHDGVRNFTLYRGMEVRPLFVYENRHARPFARFARSVEALETSEAVQQRLAAERATGQAYVIGAAPATAADASASVELTRVRPGRISLRVRTATRQLLVIAEAFHPGWRIRQDTQLRAPVQVNLALLGAFVDPGQHTLEFEFVPLRFELGVAISALALLALMALAALTLLAARRARTTPPPNRGA